MRDVIDVLMGNPNNYPQKGEYVTITFNKHGEQHEMKAMVTKSAYPVDDEWWVDFKGGMAFWNDKSWHLGWLNDRDLAEVIDGMHYYDPSRFR